MPTVNAPTPACGQLPALGPDGNWMLSVLVKCTYRLLDSGRCVLAEEPLPLHEEIVTDPANPELVIADADLYPYKLATDVVVRGQSSDLRSCAGTSRCLWRSGGL